VAVVTGGGRGIGRAIALRYAREGATVVISSRTQSDLDAVATQIADEGGTPALAIVADASDRTEARRPVLEAIDRFGGVDVLVNNVGGSVGRHHDPFTGDDDSFERTLTLPVAVNPEGASVEYSNGYLEVQLPRVTRVPDRLVRVHVRRT